MVIVFGMEGTSHIGDFHELYPMFPEYWDRGRQKLTNDIAAAARHRRRVVAPTSAATGTPPMSRARSPMS